MTARYDKIGIGYDSTRKADPYLTNRLFELLQTHTDGLYVDVGCGTGNYTSALQEKGLKLIGIDPSQEMLAKAGEKNSLVEWREGTAESVGLPDGCADGVVASLTIHHWSDLSAGFAEISRILKPGSRFVLFTTLPEQTKAYWLNHYFPKMMADSIDILPTIQQITDALNAANLELVQTEKYFVQPDLQDWFLYCGKHEPERYFSPAVRSGISSFSLLSNREEVENGLQQLREDIQQHRFEAIARQHENDLGDYLFIVSRKN